jgi:hypothetical protein
MFWQLQDSKKRALAVFRKTSFVSFALTDSLLPLSFFLSAARIAFWPLQSQSLCLLAEPKDPLLSKIIENTLLFLSFCFLSWLKVCMSFWKLGGFVGDPNALETE